MLSSSDLGIATHYVASARLPALVARLHELENPTARMVDRALEEFYSDGLPEDKPAQLTSGLRAAIDSIFSKDSIEDIFAALKSPAKHVDAAWAAETLAQLELRSPTSLHLALLAIRKGRSMKLAEALKMELDIATAYCVRLSIFLFPFHSDAIHTLYSLEPVPTSIQASRPCWLTN